MKRNILLYCFLMVISAGVSAQKHTIYIDDFSSEIKVPDRAIMCIRAAFMDGIRNTNRVDVIDALSTNSDFNADPLEDARRHKAEYLLTGKLLKRKATDDGSSQRRYHSRSENCYKEKFTLRLDLIRAADGISISTKTYEESGSVSGKDANQYAALERALLGVPYLMGTFVEDHFKARGEILKLNTDNGKKAKTVYINLGYNDPIKEGGRFDVIENETIAGNPIEKKVGEVRIDKVMGAKISLCKVNKGGDVILQKLKEGVTLRVVSRQAKLFDDQN